MLYWAGGISTRYDLSTLYQNYLTAEIDDGRPIIAGIRLSGNIGHVVVIRGYTGSGGYNVGNVIFNDPDPNLPGRREISYDDFVQNGTSWTWNETIRLITDPRTPIPLGLDDWCRIYDGGTTTITPSTTSLSYTAGFYNGDIWPTHPVSWEWKLIFVHSSGDCIARSWTSTSTGSELTWNITGFSLPSGYLWYYNYDGKIPGRVELDLLDSDGYHHHDAINVVYVPSNLYPGFVLYEDNTVSSTQPEVKAHQLIVTQNDQFLSGGNITFRAGERIDIRDGITIQKWQHDEFYRRSVCKVTLRHLLADAVCFYGVSILYLYVNI